MGIQDFGWVYHNPDKPPRNCSCGRELDQIRYAYVCPKCDVTLWWPNMGPEKV